jgi:hypothetical protein
MGLCKVINTVRPPGLTATSYMVKYLRISSYMTLDLIPQFPYICMRKIFFYFLSVRYPVNRWKGCTFLDISAVRVLIRSVQYMHINIAAFILSYIGRLIIRKDCHS